MGMGSAGRPQMGGGKGQPQVQPQRPQMGGGKGQPQGKPQMGGLGGGKGQITRPPDTFGSNGTYMGMGGMQNPNGSTLMDFAQHPQMPPQMGGGKGVAGQPMQQPPQMGGLGGGKGNVGPNDAPINSPLGGGKGQPGTPSNVPAYAQPYIDKMMGSLPQQPSQLGAAAAGLGGGFGPPAQYPFPKPSNVPTYAQPFVDAIRPQVQPQLPQYGTPEGIAYEKQQAFLRDNPNAYAPQNVYAPQQPSNVPTYAQPFVDAIRPQVPGQQLAPGSVAPTQAEIDRIRPMLSTPAQPVAAPKPFVSQPVMQEGPRQAQQRAMQQMANAKRGLPGGLR
jgi:hypothetical protein